MESGWAGSEPAPVQIRPMRYDHIMEGIPENLRGHTSFEIVTERTEERKTLRPTRSEARLLPPVARAEEQVCPSRAKGHR